MKKITIAIAMLISASAHSQKYDHDTGDSIEICFDSVHNRWLAISQYPIVVSDTSGKEQIQLQAMIVHQNGKFEYKGFAIIYDGGVSPCIDSSQIKIVFTDGTTYEGETWSKSNCESMCFFDLYGQDSYVLKKKIALIYFRSKKNGMTFIHEIKKDETSNYFIRTGNAINKKEFIVKNCE